MFPPAHIDPPELYRVEFVDHPQSLYGSAAASVLEAPPDHLPYRRESMAIVDRDTALTDTVAHTPAFVGRVSPTETLRALNVDSWHLAGHFGEGVRVAVFDVEWFGATWPHEELLDPRGNVSTHDCVQHRSCNPPIDPSNARFGFERGVHGLACAEVIRDLAPESELHLVRVNSATSLENAVDWAIRSNIDLISMSMSFFNESFYDGSGPINQLMSKLNQAGILMVTSAGNYASQHYRSEFVDEDHDQFFDFADSRGLPIYLREGIRNINLIWDDFNRCGSSDLDATLWNREGELVARSTRVQDRHSNNCAPIERVKAQIINEDWHFLKVELVRGQRSPAIDIMARGSTVYQGTQGGSIVDPGTHPSVLTIGAVRVDDYVNSPLEGFSSQGPTATGLLKPDLVGPNGLSTESYGPKGFFGTSASTPAVTGALAVLLSGTPKLSPLEAAVKLKRNALNAFPSEPYFTADNEFGFGRARLPQPPDRSPTRCGGMWSLLALFFLRRRPKFSHPKASLSPKKWE